MFKYIFGIFHIVIITSILVGCGYKTDPVWVNDTNQTHQTQQKAVNDK